MGNGSSKLLKQFSDRLWSDTELRDRFIQAFDNPPPLHPCILWCEDPPLERPFAVETPQPWQPERVDRLSLGAQPGKHPAHDRGAYYCLDFSSVFAASPLLHLSGIQTAIDVCAAPGGKSLFTWHTLQPDLLVCNEVVGKRLGTLMANLRRCQVSNVSEPEEAIGPDSMTPVSSGMPYSVDPPKSPLERGTFTAPLSKSETFTTPLSKSETFTTPLSKSETFTAPLSKSETFTTPLSKSETFTAPLSKSETFAAPLSKGGWGDQNAPNKSEKRCIATQLDPQRLAQQFPQAFQLVLVDAPCSGQSLLLKQKKVPGCFHKVTLNRNANRQKRIVGNAAQLVAPQGYLLYMTCTYSLEENEQICNWLLKKYPHFQPVSVPHLLDYQSHLSDLPCYRLWPYQGLGAGAFTALFQNQNLGEVRAISREDLAAINRL
ncbi:RsmB/NOP family class I SAM-dependent RNA methyltransferase [Roseofilum sp. BLCC_M154]|uniref:RsmB/NOP family class I SAM-dependent RNA methyltransferase n=1 Tax=Roseofilum acuticapitatum BLCC-M154 TaxID=3022444 RepID=A0ABT7AYD0_9CYAN|nr:hypothetical protein [Roseofilum acuticapitatum]MDJ1171321.1 RsmB/NOP family class I SAM-dependent RNA methyltransferase [Roseofilum acuticapitatum BLCC-M154]